MARAWVFGLGALLAAGCAGPGMPIPVQGSVEPLVGHWVGEYRSPDTGRDGSIMFTLSAGADTAWGDVVMMPADYDRGPQLTRILGSIDPAHECFASASYDVRATRLRAGSILILIRTLVRRSERRSTALFRATSCGGPLRRTWSTRDGGRQAPGRSVGSSGATPRASRRWHRFWLRAEPEAMLRQRPRAAAAG